MSTAPVTGGLVLAQLGFLAIFNPSLGHTDETVDDQIVYYASVTTQTSPQKRRRMRGRPTQGLSQEERHERLRQIGLAQGMASFSRGFANGAAVDTIDTEKSRLVLHELEPGWWLLASIDLTKVPLPPRLPTKNGDAQEERYEFSTKEMKPANLLLRDLLRAHSLFLLHHDSSLSALFVRTRRSKFVATLSRYWDLYLSTWNVMLHGNPIRDVFGGINIAGSGELGVGVGEEDRGSAEREVLEGLVGRMEGLVDVVVSKFGDYDPAAEEEGSHASTNPWLGSGAEPAAEDGAIFVGTGALSRKSLRDVTNWMEDLYTWGEHAYGVIDSPTSLRRRKRTGGQSSHDPPDDNQKSPDHNNAINGSQNRNSAVNAESTPQKPDQQKDETGLDKMVSYLKLGYGSYWSFPGGSGTSTGEEAASNPNNSLGHQGDAQADSPAAVQRPSLPKRSSSFDVSGHYLIGLKGNIEEGNSDGDLSPESEDAEVEHNSRTVLRTVNVELESGEMDQPEATIIRDFRHPGSILTRSQVVGNMLPGYDSHNLNKATKLRVVVYVNKPFIFVFLFGLRTDSLAWDTLYRSLHHQLAPLRKPLLASTKYRAERPSAGPAASSINDLVWDPSLLTIHCNIPNVPAHYAVDQPWSRIDAISTHLNLLNVYGATRSRLSADLERTQKTSRGWWIVWTRVMHGKSGRDLSASGNLSTIHESTSEARGLERRRSSQDNEDSGNDDEEQTTISKEIFLVRCASDHARNRGASGSYAEMGALESAGKLAQGIGIDTRRYVEDLLSLL